MTHADFVHLHVHTQYSLLDGACLLDRLVQKAALCKLPALAITDHGNIFGAIKFYNLCMKNGIKPIIGCEVYITSGSRLDRDYKPNGDSNHHLILLAKDQQGYSNLIKLVSLAHLEGFYYKPRVDKELLSEYSKGLIASSACLKGEIPSAIISGNVGKATKLADEYLNIFGKGNFYLEVMENGLDEQRVVNAQLVKISKDLDIPLVATNDIHYLEKEESFAHEALLAIQTQTTLNDPNRFKFNSDSFYFRTPEEMKKIFKDIPESLRNTIEITQKCNLTMDFSQIHLPHFPLPKEINDDDYLRDICQENLESRYPKAGKAVIERLDYELDTIKKTGFSSYFLIIWDLVKFAKENHIPVGPGRGCFLPDTKVLMADGRQVDIQDIKAGDYVVSHNGSVNKVKNLFVYDIKENVLTIKAKMPVFDLKLTADHKVLAIRHKMCNVKSMKKTICKPTCLRYCKNKLWKRYKTEWIEASQLKKNNLLLYPKPKTTLQSKRHVFDLTDFHLNDTNFRYDSRSVWYTIGTNNIIQKKIKRFIKLDSRMGRLFGYYVSEGWGRTGKREAMVGFGFSKAERDKHREVQRLLKEIFGLDSKIIPHTSRYSCQVVGYSKIVAIFFEMLCGKYAKNKRIPKEIFYSSDKIKVEFLTGVFLGDGSNKEKMRVAYDTVSYGLASQIKMLLASLNIMSSIKLRKYKNSKWNNSYKLTISGKQLFYFNRFFKDFKANIKKQAFYRNDTFIDKDYIYFPIQEVSSQKYKGKVYDLSVKKDKTYVANEIAVHNSAAGSIVSYILHITDVDPLSYDLLFERFLNPARISMPDIDIDFCYEKRTEVLGYVAKKYGKDNVAQIITFGTMLARAVIRDVGRVMSFNYSEVDKIAKMIPYGVGHHVDLRRALSMNPELADIYETDNRVKRLIDVAMQLEGLSRHASTHAAGVVISDKPLIDRVPLIRGAEGEAVTGFDMGSLEKTGLLKMDFLGLKTLTVIDETVKIIKRTRGIDLDITTIPLKDRKTFSLLAEGSTIGVFQLESRGMRDILKKMNPTKFEDLIAVLALYRPGPLGSGMVDDFINRKQGKKSIFYIHPKLESILKKTYGIILYQEQIMQIVAKLAGFDMARADLLRKSIGKKIPEIMDEQRQLFLDGCRKNNIATNTANQIFDLIDYFSGYGFNKCVTGNTDIVDAETGEIVKIEEVYRNRSVNFTLGCNDDLKIKKLRITNIVKNGIKPVWKLKTSLGKEIEATANHPFLMMDGWKKLEDIKKGERIALPRIYPLEGNNPFPAYKIISLAGILSEGNTCHTSGAYFYAANSVYFNDFIKNVKEFPNTFPTVIRRRNIFEAYCGTGRDARFCKGDIPWNKKGGAVCLEKTVIRSGFRVWLEELDLVYKKAREKFIPSFISGLNNKLLALFIGRLWSGDGFVFAKRNSLPFYATSSKQLVFQLQDLLVRFGILSKIYKKEFKYRYKGKTTIKRGYVLMLQGRSGVDSFIKHIVPYIVGRGKNIERLKTYYKKAPGNKESKDVIPQEIKFIVQRLKNEKGIGWREFEKDSKISMKELVGGLHKHKEGFRRDTIKRLGEYFNSPELIKYASSDLYWDKVVSVEYVGKKTTYDLQIERYHNFVANGIIVHNSHSTAYALISYRTAYLKANYPVEFMAALLTSERNNTDKIVEYVNESGRIKIEVLPPDINTSFTNFTVTNDQNIRFGLMAIKNVGKAALENIIETRKASKFGSIFDFSRRVDSRVVNKKVIESLIKSGAMDSFNLRRAQMVALLDKILNKSAKKEDPSQLRLFSDPVDESVPDIEEWPLLQILSFEKALLGIYLTGHPLSSYSSLVNYLQREKIIRLWEHPRQGDVMICGVVEKVKNITTRRKGQRMAILKLEDETASIEVFIFPRLFDECAFYLREATILVIRGKVEAKDEVPKVLASQVIPVEKVSDYIKSANISLENNGISLNNLKSVFFNHKGQTPVFFSFKDSKLKGVKIKTGSKFCIALNEKALNEIGSAVGEGNLSLTL